MNSKIVVIAGPTASGKTAFSVSLAKKLNAAIINADSRQVYANMQIGTARPTAEELAGVEHYLFGHTDIKTHYNAATYADDARQIIAQLQSIGKHIIVSGGTGLYIRAIFEPLDDIPEVSPEIRQAVMDDLEKFGLINLTEELKLRDADYYASVDLQNKARVSRAIEVLRETGKPYSSFIKQSNKAPKLNADYYFIDLPREQLYEKINLRTDLMLKAGWLAEAVALYPDKNLKALHTVGYTELFRFIDGTISLEKATELIKQHTRNYAKRQLTWFRNQGDYRPVLPDETHLKEIINRHSL